MGTPLGPKYIPYTYIDPVGPRWSKTPRSPAPMFDFGEVHGTVGGGLWRILQQVQAPRASFLKTFWGLFDAKKSMKKYGAR